MSTIITLLSVSAMTVENLPQPSTNVLNKGKEMLQSTNEKGNGEEICLDEDIVIPNWDTSNLTFEQMDTLG